MTFVALVLGPLLKGTEHRGPEMAPRWTPDGSKRAQDGPKWVQDDLKGPKMAPNGRLGAQYGSPHASREVPDRSQIGLGKLSNIEAERGLVNFYLKCRFGGGGGGNHIKKLDGN